MKNIEVLLDNILEKDIFYPKNVEVSNGDRVIVKVDNILHSGTVIATEVPIETKNSIVRVATDEDFDKEIEKMAESYKMEKDKVKEMIGEDGAKQIKEDLAVSKAADFVTENAKEETKAKKSKKAAKEEAAEE